MMLYCPACKERISRDSRTKVFKTLMTKKGYPSYCIKKEKQVYLKPSL